MGSVDCFAKRVADEITKAPICCANTMTEAEMRSRGGIAQTDYGYGQYC
jgi:hypothetical protein